MFLNINYNNKNEVLIQGTRDDYNFISNYLLRIDSDKIIYLLPVFNQYYPISINGLYFSLNDKRKLLSFYVEGMILYIEGNKAIFKKLSYNIISPMSIADDDFHTDIFYYEGNGLMDNNDLFITFEIK
jgi:hypothetical protein